MKAILEFDLSDSSDTLALRRALSADSAYMVFYELDAYLRKIVKYDNIDEISIAELREVIADMLENRGINMEDLE